MEGGKRGEVLSLCSRHLMRAALPRTVPGNQPGSIAAVGGCVALEGGCLAVGFWMSIPLSPVSRVEAAGTAHAAGG